MLRARSALLAVIDIQGRLSQMVVDHEKTYSNVIRLIKTARVFLLPIVWTQQAPDKIGETIPEIAKELSDIKVINKLSFSCWPQQEFAHALVAYKRPQIILTGIETHVCVYQTAIDLLTHGYEVFLVADAVSARFVFDHQVAIEDLRAKGVHIISMEMVLTQLLEGAQNPKFKEAMTYFKRG